MIEMWQEQLFGNRIMFHMVINVTTMDEFLLCAKPKELMQCRTRDFNKKLQSIKSAIQIVNLTPNRGRFTVTNTRIMYTPWKLQIYENHKLIFGGKNSYWTEICWFFF